MAALARALIKLTALAAYKLAAIPQATARLAREHIGGKRDQEYSPSGKVIDFLEVHNTVSFALILKESKNRVKKVEVFSFTVQFDQHFNISKTLIIAGFC